MLIFRQQLTEIKERQILANMSERQAHLFGIVDKETDKLIGNCGLNAINTLHRKASFGIFIGDQNYWNKGFGTEATKLVLDYAFNILNLHNIQLEVFSFNKRAINSYQKAGFKTIGRRREAIILAGEKYDEIYMDILADEFESIYIKSFME